MEDIRKTARAPKGKVVAMPDVAEQGIMEKVMGEKAAPIVIEPYQLRKLQEFNTMMGQAREAVGDLTIGYELQKEGLLSKIKEVRGKMGELEKEITDRHGKNITIDINTGVVNYKDVQENVQEG